MRALDFTLDQMCTYLSWKYLLSKCKSMQCRHVISSMIFDTTSLEKPILSKNVRRIYLTLDSDGKIQILFQRKIV